MSFTNQTTHYGLPQWIGSDKPTYLVDQNNAYQTIDSEIYNANTTAGAAQTAAEGAVQTAGAASSTAADALTAAQTASSTADNALTEAQTANTNAQAAQTAAGAAQTAAQAAQEAAAGNSITNLAPAYDPTITYAVDDLVTAEGKLYKCIVAVVTPEQFDINKWDDVTTSEVYARASNNYKFVAQASVTIAADSSKTNSVYLTDAMTSALNQIRGSLGANELAIIHTVVFDNANFLVNTEDIETAASTHAPYMSLSAIANSTSSLVVSSIVIDTASLYQKTVLANNDITFSDESGTTDSSSLIVSYYRYSK